MRLRQRCAKALASSYHARERLTKDDSPDDHIVLRVALESAASTAVGHPTVLGTVEDPTVLGTVVQLFPHLPYGDPWMQETKELARHGLALLEKNALLPCDTTGGGGSGGGEVPANVVKSLLHHAPASVCPSNVVARCVAVAMGNELLHLLATR